MERSEVWQWPSDHGESEMPVFGGLCCSVGEGQLWEVKNEMMRTGPKMDLMIV